MEIDWTKVKALGKVTDRELAAQFRVGHQTVGRARKALGIPAFKTVKTVKRRPPRKPPFNWDTIKDFGVTPDSTIAKRLGRPLSSVRDARVARGIKAAPYKARQNDDIDWSKVSDLGKTPDTVIAKRLGVTQPTVWAARNSRGIPPFGPSAGRRPKTNLQPLQPAVLIKDLTDTVDTLIALSLKELSPDAANAKLGKLPLTSPGYLSLCDIFTGKTNLRDMFNNILNDSK